MINNLNSRPVNIHYNHHADLYGSYGVCPEIGWAEAFPMLFLGWPM